jgi:uncharacterized protein (TIGR03118 family)
MRPARARRLGAAAVVAAALAAASLSAAAVSRSRPDAFVLRNLVADPGFPAAAHDPQLVNAWGLAASATGPWWTSNEARGSSTLYAGNGHKQALTISVPCGPTGVVFNGGPGFAVRGGGTSGPARFLYACEDGTIRGWSPTVPNGWSAQAEIAVDGSGTAAVFKGVALATLPDGSRRLYATDFHNGRILAFDSRWRLVALPGGFRDPSIRTGYAPFNLLVAGSRIFVSYAEPAPVDGNDSPKGGFLDEFDLQGRLLARIGRGSPLDEPWGLAIAPRGFGTLGGALLVGNFGSGRINAYRPSGDGWRYAGQLRTPGGKPLVVSGLWGIAFGTGGMSGPKTTLFVAAGPHRWRGSSELAVHGLLAAVAPAV